MASEVRHNERASRYELHIDGELAGIADYALDGDTVEIPHTEIDPARRGQGLGAVLVRATLDDLRTRCSRVVPSCWYVAQFIDENPAYADLLT